MASWKDRQRDKKMKRWKDRKVKRLKNKKRNIQIDKNVDRKRIYKYKQKEG